MIRVSMRINGLPCNVCGGTVKHLPNCAYDKIRKDKPMFETVMFLELMERVRNLCHQTAKDKGFWGSPEEQENEGSWNFGEKVALIHSELSEMFEAWRKGAKESDKDIRVIDPLHRTPDDPIGTRRVTAIEEEVADVFIRLMDLCGKLKIDVGRVVLAKMDYNKGRPHLHGGRKC